MGDIVVLVPDRAGKEDSSQEASNTELVDIVEEDSKVDIPNGGFKAWMQVFVSFMVHFVVVGMINSFGVYQAAFKFTDIFKAASTLSLSFIGSATPCGLYLFGSLSGLLADRFGYRPMAGIGALIWGASLVLASFSSEYYHVLLTQGILLGLGTSLVYFPALSVLSHWFSTRKGLATGIGVSGGGVGGFVVSIMTDIMIRTLSWRWALRITGIVGGFILLCCVWGIEPRLASRNAKKSSRDIRTLLKNSEFIGMFLCGLFFSFGYFIPFFFVSIYAISNGMTATQGAILVGILNAFNSAGRMILGLMADKISPILLLALSLLFSALSVFLIWPFATNFLLLVLFVIAYGFASGGFMSLFPTCTVFIFGTEAIASINGIIFSGTALGMLFGPPLGALLVNRFTTSNVTNFVPLMIFSASNLFVSSIIMFIVKFWHMKRRQ